MMIINVFFVDIFINCYIKFKMKVYLYEMFDIVSLYVII